MHPFKINHHYTNLNAIQNELFRFPAMCCLRSIACIFVCKIIATIWFQPVAQTIVTTSK